MRNRARNNLGHSFAKLGTLLAWLAIFIWLADVTWRFTGLDGITNTLYRFVIGNWLNWKPIAGGGWHLITASGLYWFGIVMVLVVCILLLRKIFTKHEDEPVERVERALEDIKEGNYPLTTRNGAMI